jgi:hypothetical protein
MSFDLDDIGQRLARLRPEAEALLELLLASYRTGSPTVRTSIRSLFALNSSFTWATPVRPPLTTEQGFRQALLKISAVDRAQDMRDTILHLNEISAKAEAAGVNTGPIFDEVAALSSDESDGKMWGLCAAFFYGLGLGIPERYENRVFLATNVSTRAALGARSNVTRSAISRDRLLR